MVTGSLPPLEAWNLMHSPAVGTRAAFPLSLHPLIHKRSQPPSCLLAEGQMLPATTTEMSTARGVDEDTKCCKAIGWQCAHEVSRASPQRQCGLAPMVP